MRRTAVLLLVTLVAAITFVAPGSAASAETGPTITLNKYCPVLGGAQWYGALGSVSGLPANSTFVGTVSLDGLTGSTTYTADANGSYGDIGFATDVKIEIASFTVEWSGGTLFTTLERPCQPPLPPTTIAECKHGGFSAYGFKSEGACVKYVVKQAIIAWLKKHVPHT